jgi:hypothetical protein
MRGRALALGACVVAASLSLLSSAAAQEEPKEPNLNVAPAQHDFGSLCPGISAARSFTITNTAAGSEDLEISSITRSGSTRFAPQNVPTPPPIPANKSADFSVTFTAPTHGAVSATYTVKASNGSDPQDTVSVQGRGVDRRIASDRSSVAFGEQRVGTRSPTQTIIVRNPGQDPVKVTNLRKIGAHPGDFRVLAPSLPFSIGAGNFVSFTASFQPTGAGLRNARLEISSDACTKSKLSVSLVGTGAVAKVLVDPNPIDVGTSPLDVQGAPVAVTVSNTGGAPLKITAVQVLGTDAEDFVLEDLPTMPATVPVAESFIFHVRMTPTAEGPRIARINILSDDPGAPSFSVDLRGTGGKASPSPTPSTSASESPSASLSASPSTRPQAFGAAPNDNLAVVLVIVAVLLAFLGLVVIRRLIAVPDDEE